MNVYLVPAGGDRHELYCEVAAAPAPDDGRPHTLWGRMVASFKRALAEGEAEERRHPGAEDPHPERGRLRRWITRKLAEAVAEMRLLWHLRSETAATLVFPSDLDESRALAEARRQFGLDLAKHRRWAIIDAVLTLITGPLFFFVPGPNVVSWYFTFRAVGHYFAMRGARQGLSGLHWTLAASVPLRDVRSAIAIADDDERMARLEAIGDTLQLERFARFVERVAGEP